MRARAHLAVARDRTGATVVQQLRSAAPITLVPARANGSTLVHVVGSAAGPLGGDELDLTVHVGQDATLRLVGVAATVLLPGQHDAPSRSTVRFELAPGARVDYLPEPTVITARADHEAILVATLAGDARLRTREVLVLGRADERPGALTTRTSVTRDGHPVLRQHLRVGDQELDASLAGLAGRRVLATELDLDGAGADPASGQWWSRSPLAAGGSVTTALADDVVTALRLLRASRMTGE
ncbi:urease accessory protein UreD [Actinophytocola sediminis]